jgi:4-amino-4-deoxy-L-arabinose transferase-like glycosyltransferase
MHSVPRADDCVVGAFPPPAKVGGLKAGQLMTDSRLPILVLVVVVTLQALLFARVNPDRIVPGTDSEQYDLMARQLLAGHGLTLEAQAPFTPTLFREPLYPLMVAAIYQLDGANVEPIVAVQAVLLGLTAGFTAIVGTYLFGRLAGLIAGALCGLNSEVAHYAHWLLTEVPFTFLLVGAVALALRAQASERRSDFLGTGVILGLAALVRVIAAGLVVPIDLVLAFSTSKTSRLRNAALLIAGFAVVVAPWVGRNVVTFGDPTISSRFGVNLVRRAPRAAEPLSAYPNWILASLWMATNPLSNLVYPISHFQWGPDYEDNLIWDFHVNDMVRYNRRYEAVCQPQPDPDACYAQIGLAFVRAYPLRYLVQSAFALVLLLFAPLPGPQALEHNGLVWLSLVSMLVLAFRRRLSRAHLLVLVTLGAYVGGSILLDTQQRYLVPVLPFMAVFGAVPIEAVLLWLRGLALHASGAATQSRIS